MDGGLQSYSVCFRTAHNPFGVVHRVTFMLLMGIINLCETWEMQNAMEGVISARL